MANFFSVLLASCLLVFKSHARNVILLKEVKLVCYLIRHRVGTF